MELFVVNRYQINTEKNEPNEEQLKTDLLKKIEERKRKRTEDEQVDDQDCKPSDAEPTEIKVKRKRKKKKVVDENDEQLVEKPAVNFTVLGKDDHSSKKKAKRVLPHWLQSASVVSVDLQNLTHTVDDIPGLDKELINMLKENNITHFFPVQMQVVPWLLATLKQPSMYWPRDVCVSAPTGSGKTLSFVLPIIQALQNRLSTKIRAMVVLPLQDLAKQVFKVFQNYLAKTSLKAILLSSAVSLAQEQKQLVKIDKLVGYRSLVDIVVTTPGRLVDHLKSTQGFFLNDLQFLVIDEADRVMEGVQNDWLYHLNMHIGLHSGATISFQTPPLCLNTLLCEKRPPQKLLFSATLSQDPEKLQLLGLFQPKLFTSIVKSDGICEDRAEEFVGKFTTPAELTESYVTCSVAGKPIVLMHLLKERGWRHVLCFTRSREATRRLTMLLKELCKGWLKVAAFTATANSSVRDKKIKRFAKGQLDVLVCSDAMARGIDIPNVECVISYDMPKYIKNHVHRVGRTGRAGHQGIAITFLIQKQLKHFKTMMETGRKTSINEITLTDEDIETYAPQYESALGQVKKKLDIVAAVRQSRINRWKQAKPAKSKKVSKTIH